MFALALKVVEQQLWAVGLNHCNTTLDERTVYLVLIATKGIVICKTTSLTATE